MSTTAFFRVTGLLLALWLAGCTSPETPREVTRAFWESVIEKDRGAVAELSTLAEADPQELELEDGAESISLGRTVIDASEATVVVKITADGDRPDEGREIVTYLVRQGEDWAVDYDSTASSFATRSAIAQFVGELDRLGERIQESFSQSSGAISEQLDQLSEDLRERTESARQEAETVIDEYGRRLRDMLNALSESMEKALKEEETLEPKDTAVLRASVRDLDVQSDRLSNPTMENIAQSGQLVSDTRLRIRSLSDESLTGYRQAWQQDVAQLETEMDRLLTEIRKAATDS